MTAVRGFLNRMSGDEEFRPAALITPVVVIAITSLVVMMPLERSGWNIASTLNFLAFFATFVAIFGIFSLGLNVHWGYTGIFNFGVMSFFLVGANVAAIITKSPPETEFVRYVGGFGDRLDFIPYLDSEQWLPFLFGLLGAAVACGILAFFLSIPALRLREDYLAIATIGIAELLRRVTIEERGLVNGTRGLTGIPRPLGDLADPSDYTYVILAISVALLVVVYIAVERGFRSPWGRVLRAVREDELTTEASGKNVFAFKSQSFVVGSMIMGIGGAIYAYANSSISPTTFTHFFGTFIFWAMLIVGGSGNNKGAVLGAYIVWGFWTITSQLKGYPLPAFLDLRVFFIREFLIGTLIVVVLLMRPQGLLPEVRRVSIWVERHTKRSQRNKPPPGQPPPVSETN
ncbi:MAG: branched-chain amino acid ABC transporter permease [Dehalococcoidia bacterium]